MSAASFPATFIRTTAASFCWKRERASWANIKPASSAANIVSLRYGTARSDRRTNLENSGQTPKSDRVAGREIGNRDMRCLEGSFIPGVLQTAMDSSQPGYVSCIIPRDIYSDNGRVVLLEKGTRVLGEYQTGVQRGKYRLFAVWNRAVTPRGVAIDVGSPASDALGRSGMAGGVKNFFWRSEEHTSELQSL